MEGMKTLKLIEWRIQLCLFHDISSFKYLSIKFSLCGFGTI